MAATANDGGLLSMPIRWKSDIQPMLDLGLYDEVDLLFQSHIERNPTESISLCLYGYFLHFQREYLKAEKIFLKCLSIDPGNIICLNYYTDLLSAQKRWDDAYKIAQKAYEYDDSRAWTLGSYCNVLRHLKKQSDVQQICQIALNIQNLNDPDTWMTLADCCWDLKLHKLAVKIFEVALHRNPNDFELRDAFSELCIELKQLDIAAQQLTILSSSNPNNFTVHTDLGYVLREIGQISQARFHYEKALEINNKYPGAHNNLGFLLLHDIGNISQSHHHLLMAVKYDSEFPNPYRHLGDLYRCYKHNYDASKMFYIKALELRKDYKEAKYGIKLIKLLQNNIITDQIKIKDINTLDIDINKLNKYKSYLNLNDIDHSDINGDDDDDNKNDDT